MLLVMWHQPAWAEGERCYKQMSEVLECFVKLEDQNFSYEFEEEAPFKDYTLLTFDLTSQRWPIVEDDELQSTLWRHKLRIYVPKQVRYDTAMLYITGGYVRDKNGKPQFTSPKENFEYADVATNNKAIVAVLEDVPNQYQKVGDKWYKEDQIVAYTFRRVMDNPKENAYLAGHLPMVKAAVRGMDVTQKVLASRGIVIKQFLVAGASKRGWTAWLTALVDDRVKALMPLVIDILNIRKSITNICSQDLSSCPWALKDYMQEGLIARLNDPAFDDLAAIEDPFAYLQKDKKYVDRLNIPKYIINASGDDFFSPNGSDFYFDKLPGKNSLRVLPHAMHYFAGNPISDNLGNRVIFNEVMDTYFYMILNGVDAPKLTWKFSGDSVAVTTNAKPVRAKLWVAHNEKERDFRFLSSYGKVRLFLKTAGLWIAKKLGINYTPCDNCYASQPLELNCKGKCDFEVPLPVYDRGWRAAFVELVYLVDGREFTLTTGVDVSSQGKN